MKGLRGLHQGEFKGGVSVFFGICTLGDKMGPEQGEIDGEGGGGIYIRGFNGGLFTLKGWGRKG